MADLRVIEVRPAGGEYVTIEGEFNTEFRRYGPDSWEEGMGMSWEDISHRCEKHEAAYQLWKAKQDAP